jgi:hypothetical protein
MRLGTPILVYELAITSDAGTFKDKLKVVPSPGADSNVI